MAELSCGIVVWRSTAGAGLEVLLGHLGGPYWARKDAGAWSIPKGLAEPGEAPIDAARREFVEELGLPLPAGELVPLGTIRQSSKKDVVAWSLRVDGDGGLDLDAVKSNTFELEWPPRSGRMQAFPEVDRAEWFLFESASEKMVRGQAQLLDRLSAVAASGED